MGSKYFTIVTDLGTRLMLEAIGNEEKVNITEFAVGDGEGIFYVPDKSMAKLKHELWRGKVVDKKISEESENLLIVEAVMPSDVGGFTIREMGLFDDNGNLIAICNTPDTQKAKVSDGVVHELHLIMEIAISNSDSIELVVDNAVLLATKADIEKLSKKIEILSKSVETDIKSLMLEFNDQTSELYLKRGDEILSTTTIEGGIVASLIAVSALEEELYGQIVTLTSVSSGETQEATFSEDGVCSFRVRYTGEYILNCGTAEEERVKVRELGTVYDVSMSSTPKSVINVSTEESELYGETITLTGENGITYEDVFSDTGTCTFKVRTLGTYTLRYADEELTVEVTEQGASYDIVATVTPRAVINVITEEESLLGKEVVCTDGSETLTAVFSDTGECSFKVENLAIYTVTCDTSSTTVTVSNLEATYEAEIALTGNYVITLKGASGETVSMYAQSMSKTTAVLDSSGSGTATITIRKGDNVVFSGGTSGNSKMVAVSENTTVNLTSAGTDHSNAVTELLTRADIEETYTYTDIASVLSDTACLLAVISSSEAVDFMAQYTGFAASFTSNQTAMAYIGANNYAANTLLANVIWLNKIYDSAYMTKVLPQLIPTMTSNTTPEGSVTGENLSSGYEYFAFVPNATAHFNDDTGSVTYNFAKTVKVYRIRAYATGKSTNYSISLNGGQVHSGIIYDEENPVSIDVKLTTGKNASSIKYSFAGFSTNPADPTLTALGGNYGVFGRTV